MPFRPTTIERIALAGFHGVPSAARSQVCNRPSIESQSDEVTTTIWWIPCSGDAPGGAGVKFGRCNSPVPEQAARINPAANITSGNTTSQTRDRPFVFRARTGIYQRAMAEAQVRPAPNAVISITSPGLMRPVRTASSSVIGIEAADVLP